MFRPWSIPAHAGEPCIVISAPSKSGVYPRPRGGTSPHSARPYPHWGLSPPTRGNPERRPRCDTRPRSIPAHAGEPARPLEISFRPSVYPRPRGGTVSCSKRRNPTAGLSPPTRGNRQVRIEDPKRHRSIPAHAGEPTRQTAQGQISPVYPRPRGGTACTVVDDADAAGLSPPTRGNRIAVSGRCAASRSIPAHAGEPRPHDFRLRERWVYPRPRGGTLGYSPMRRCVGGLSPPTRGNLLGYSPRRIAWRSIPAHAGEPSAPPHGRRAPSVYPRPRGGTMFIMTGEQLAKGLSPPTRGNQAGG